MELLKTLLRSVKAVLIARLREFYRDKAAFYWHLGLPFFIITSFYFIFDSRQMPSYKVGVIQEDVSIASVIPAQAGIPPLYASVGETRQIDLQSSNMRFETEQTSSAQFQSRTRLNPYLPSFSKRIIPVPSVIPAKAGIPPLYASVEKTRQIDQSEEFFQLKYIQFIPQEKETGLDKIRNHALDMLIQLGSPLQYWINDSNKKAYFLEKILKGSYLKPLQKNPSLDRAVSYVDWVFPGILALNIMFSCLWGVGWLIVKYRDDGYLKRLNATPLKVYHFMLGQMLARLIIILCGTSIIFVLGSWFIGFEMQGSYWDLFVCYFFGVLSLISIGLLVASRTTSKEFADGALNLFSWPMMIFSGMWFSLEGAPSWLTAFAYSLPLTHLVESTRKIMLEGAMLSELWFNVSSMIIFSVAAFLLVAFLFKWNER